MAPLRSTDGSKRTMLHPLSPAATARLPELTVVVPALDERDNIVPLLSCSTPRSPVSLGR